MTRLRRKLIAFWTIALAAVAALALRQALIGYGLFVVALIIRFSIPWKAMSRAEQLLLLGAVICANLAFWFRDIAVLPNILWTLCDAVVAWIILDGIWWNIRLFRQSAPPAASQRSSD